MAINASSVEQVEVRTFNDIKKVIREFLPDSNPRNIVVRTKMRDEDGKLYELSAPTGCDYKSLMQEGFKIVRDRINAENKVRARGLVPPIVIDGHMWLDDLIERRLGGHRDGTRIKWVLNEGTYYFDPESGKVTKEINNEDNR